MTAPTFLLFDHPISSYAQKVRVVLREKGVPFTVVNPLGLSGGGIDPIFAKANPRGEVPVLLVVEEGQDPADALAVVDSRVICEYLEDAHPDNPVMPRKAGEKAKARMIEQVCDAQYEAVNWGWGEVLWMGRAEGELREQLKSETAQQTHKIQAWLEERISSSGWLSGTDFGIADASAGPIVHRSAYFGFGPAPGSRLAEWLDRVRDRPSMKETLQEFDDTVHTMFGLRDMFLSGERKREYRDYRLEFLVKSGAIGVVQEGLKNNNIRFPWPEGSLSSTKTSL